MRTVTDRVEHLAAQRRIHDWIKKFRALAKEMPPEVWVYVAASRPHIMANNEKGRPYEHPKHDGMDPDASIALIQGGHWDGGDW